MATSPREVTRATDDPLDSDPLPTSSKDTGRGAVSKAVRMAVNKGLKFPLMGNV